MFTSYLDQMVQKNGYKKTVCMDGHLMHTDPVILRFCIFLEAQKWILILMANNMTPVYFNL